MPFGNTSSPFLLNATIRHHVSKYPPSKAKQELEENLYVDDWCTGGDDDQEACALHQDGQKILAEGGFQLAKFNSNE